MGRHKLRISIFPFFKFIKRKLGRRFFTAHCVKHLRKLHLCCVEKPELPKMDPNYHELRQNYGRITAKISPRKPNFEHELTLLGISHTSDSPHCFQQVPWLDVFSTTLNACSGEGLFDGWRNHLSNTCAFICSPAPHVQSGSCANGPEMNQKSTLYMGGGGSRRNRHHYNR